MYRDPFSSFNSLATSVYSLIPTGAQDQLGRVKSELAAFRVSPEQRPDNLTTLRACSATLAGFEYFSQDAVKILFVLDSKSGLLIPQKLNGLVPRENFVIYTSHFGNKSRVLKFGHDLSGEDYFYTYGAEFRATLEKGLLIEPPLLTIAWRSRAKNGSNLLYTLQYCPSIEHSSETPPWIAIQEEEFAIVEKRPFRLYCGQRRYHQENDSITITASQTRIGSQYVEATVISDGVPRQPPYSGPFIRLQGISEIEDTGVPAELQFSITTLLDGIISESPSSISTEKLVLLQRFIQYRN